MTMNFTYKHDIPCAAEKQPPSYAKEDSNFAEGKGLEASSASIYSSESNVTLADEASFNPGTHLHVHARGHDLIRLPIPSSELETTITDSSRRPVYISTRAQRCSGNAILSHVNLGDLISTTYFFGPGRDPVLKLLQSVDASLETIRMHSRWTTRATAFTLPDGRSFEWFYHNFRNSIGEHVNVLVLRQIDADSAKLKKKGKNKSKVIAKLIRSKETRTKGTTRRTAGNGGELVLDVDAARYLDESMVVATCLMMLKKEVDRRRGMQLAVMAGAAGGGGS